MGAVSLTEFARMVGISKQAVGKALRARLPARLIGQDERRGWPIILDADEALAIWRAATDERKKRPTETYQANGKQAWETRRGAQPPPAAASATEPRAPKEAPVLNAAASRAITEAYKARMAKVDYEERIGKLVDAAEFKVLYAQRVATARNQLRGVASKFKAVVPSLTAGEVQKLLDLIDEALATVAKS